MHGDGHSMASASIRREITDANLQKARQYCEISVVGEEVTRANSAREAPPQEVQTPERSWPLTGSSHGYSHGNPDADKAALEAEAFSKVMEQIRQQGSPAFVWIQDWPARFQSSLGQLKTFIESCSEHFEIVMEPGYSRKYRVALKDNTPVRHVCESSSPAGRDGRSWTPSNSWQSWRADENACSRRDDSWVRPSRKDSEDVVVSKEEVLQWFLGQGARNDAEWVLSKLKVLRPDLLDGLCSDRMRNHQ
eukprot:TRINITY_DN62291_c0_g1_i1.p1 TRINITY_DN62291_c0_g1~~TRINITY_DN62291_c0_g1_i1.p1  ORF type:complete len:249 (+),score=35.43 TRINITY_DN62291_c0_g1_i1:169-915(+)